MSASDTDTANRERLRRELDEAWSQDDLDLLDELYAPNVRIGTERTGQGGLVSVADVKAVHADWDTGFPDGTTTINAMAAEDDAVLAWWTLRGTHDGEFRGFEPTGAEVEVDGFSYRRYEDGLAVEVKDSASMHDLLTQLGAEYVVQ